MRTPSIQKPDLNSIQNHPVVSVYQRYEKQDIKPVTQTNIKILNKNKSKNILIILILTKIL